MANEIIKLLEYLMNNSIVNAVLVAYAIMSVVVLAIVIAVFVVVLKQFFNIHKSHKRNKRR